MERERIARENEEKELAEKTKKIKEQFDDPNKQWEKDKSDLQNLAKEQKDLKKGGEAKPATHSSKEKDKKEKKGEAAAESKAHETKKPAKAAAAAKEEAAHKVESKAAKKESRGKEETDLSALKEKAAKNARERDADLIPETDTASVRE